jgi:hypothetical protein
MRRGRSSKGSSLRRVVFVNASRHTPLRPARAICAAVLVVVSLATGSSAEVVSLEPDEPWCGVWCGFYAFRGVKRLRRFFSTSRCCDKFSFDS